MATINMQTMRYINLFDRITNIKTRWCFTYNNFIVFAVPARFMSQAIGISGKHVRVIQDTLGKKIKIVKEAEGLEDTARFIHDVVEPLGFRSLEITDKEIIMTAGGHHKASLIGRNRARLSELSKILEDSLGRTLRIV